MMKQGTDPNPELRIINDDRNVGTWLRAQRLPEIAKALYKRNKVLSEEVIAVYEKVMDCTFPREELRRKKK